jgi:hypothetical protein
VIRVSVWVVLCLGYRIFRGRARAKLGLVLWLGSRLGWV